MRRSAFLACTGLSVDQYVYMCRNNHLPFLDSEDREGWADYSWRQTFLTAVAVELAPLVGGQAEAARRVVEFPHAELRRIWGGLFRPHLGDVFAASFTTQDPTDHPRWSVERSGWVLSLVGRQARENVLDIPDALIGADVLSLPTLNLSAIMRRIQTRAAAAGIPFDEDVDA